ncbi:Lipase member K [Schistosoma japonicum]|nr:Lipase member K [Schistosoma japonicum]
MEGNALLSWFLLLLIFNVFFDDAHKINLPAVEKLLEAIENGFDPEVYQNITEIIASKGYDTQEHYVTTQDGYILCIIRILPKCHGISENPKVVLLQHGLLDSAHTWVNNLANESLGFILADNCYDVWLGNSRGNTYSSKHQFLKPDSKEYWEFSWDEMGKYDLPSTMLYILNHTNANSLSYIGHSQGCQVALACFHEHPLLQSYVNVFIALAPAVFLGSIKSPIRYIAPYIKTVEPIVEWFGNGEFLPSSKITSFLASFLCKPNHIPFVCSNIMYLIAGYNVRNTNETRLPIYVAHSPAGTSVQNMVHYCQGIMSDNFQKFDYGTEMNLKVYNQSNPPLYNLTKFTIPIVLYYGGYDWLASPKDIYKLIQHIKYTITSVHYFPHYNHIDFVWGLNAGKVLYPSVLKELSKVYN